MRPSRVVLAATVVGSPPLSAAVCSVAASMAAIDLMLVYRVVPAWPTRVGGLRQPTTVATRPSGFGFIIFRGTLPLQPSNPIRNQARRHRARRSHGWPPCPAGGRQRLTRHWAYRSQLTRPSRRITLASLPYPLMTVSPWMRLDKVRERVFVCRITLSKAARCRFCPF